MAPDPWAMLDGAYQSSSSRYPQSAQQSSQTGAQPPASRGAWSDALNGPNVPDYPSARSESQYPGQYPRQYPGQYPRQYPGQYDDAPTLADAPTSKLATPTSASAVADEAPTQRLHRAQTATIPTRGAHGSDTWAPQTEKKRQRRQPRARRAIWLLAIVVVLAACILPSSVFAFNTYSLYSQDKQLASSGEAHLREGADLLREVAAGQVNPTLTAEAKQQFTQAHSIFIQLQGNLAQTPGAVNSVPHYGDELASARKIAPIAVEGAQMGVLASDAVNILLARLSNPFGANSDGLTSADLKTISADLAQVKILLATLTTQINQLQPADLQIDPRLSSALAQFKSALPSVQQGLTDAQTMVALAPSLLGVGQPSNYFIEVLDSTEIRPGGGFIGNYGTLTVSAGRLSQMHITDVDLLDRPFEFAGGFIPYPPQYQWFNLAGAWSLRDSNLDADFPTAARYGEQNYHLEGGKDQFQGVIAITPYLIQKAMAITGPIYVPEFKQTVTPANLIDLIHYHQLGPGHGSEYIPDPGSLSSQRKKFTAYLFKHFLDRVKAIASAKRSEFVHLLVSALQTKDVQVYFNAPGAEAVLMRYHAASTIDAPKTGDSLMIVDANVIANKANDFIRYTMQDNVSLDAQGNATHHATLTYRWPVSSESSANDYGSTTFYKDYLRIYAPPQSTLQAQSGWAAQGSDTAFGRRVFIGILYLNYGSTVTISLTWTTPKAAVQNGKTWQYSLLFQKQAGITWNATTQITPPSCASNIGQLSKLKAGANHAYIAQGYLYMDTTYALSYTC